MKIGKHIFSEIVNIKTDISVEIGGILGGDGDVVRIHYLDRGLQSGRVCSYTPDVTLLNAIIAEWQANDIQFMGIYHTHFHDVQTLSEGDIRYIHKIMKNMPDILEKLYFPIVTLPGRNVISYVATRESGVVKINEDHLVLI